MSVCRVVRATYNGVTVPSGGSAGKDNQEIKFAITATAGIAAGTANQCVYEWTGANIPREITALLFMTAAGEIIPFGLAAQNTHALMTMNTNPVTGNKGFYLTIPAAGIPLPANTTIFITAGVGQNVY